MKATGWCENCGDVEVEVQSIVWLQPQGAAFLDAAFVAAYADCPICGGDADQWAW